MTTDIFLQLSVLRYEIKEENEKVLLHLFLFDIVGPFR